MFHNIITICTFVRVVNAAESIGQPPTGGQLVNTIILYSIIYYIVNTYCKHARIHAI